MATLSRRIRKRIEAVEEGNFIFVGPPPKFATKAVSDCSKFVRSEKNPSLVATTRETIDAIDALLEARPPKSGAEMPARSPVPARAISFEIPELVKRWSAQ
jgi:hypothetical protein